MYCISYVIKKGDTLYKISRQYNVGINDIMKANPFINVYNLMVDEVLCIPVTTAVNQYTNFTTYLVEDGDTLGGVLVKNNINLADLMALNDPKEIYLLPGSTLKVPIIGEGESGITL